jgi:PAS domain S-box-containing protein
VITGDYLVDDSFKHAEPSDRYIREHGIRSVISAPLIGEDGPIGSLTVHTQEPDAFGPAAAELLELLAAHAAIAVTNARLYERLHARIDAQRTLAEISAEIAALREPAAVIQRTVNEAVRLLVADRAQINPLQADGDVLGLPLASAPHDLPIEDVEVRVGTGVSGTALARRRIVSTGDYLKDRSFRHSRAGDARIRDAGLRSLMAAPLIGSSGPIGVLTVQSTRPSAFDEGDAELLGHLADQAAIAITNTRLYEELTERMEAQRALAEIAAQIAALRDPQAVLQRSVDEAVRLLGADCALLNPYEPEAKVLELAVAASPPDTRLDDVVVPLGTGVSGRAIAERRVVRTGDYHHDRAFEHATPIDDYIERRAVVSVMTAPLVGGEGPIGALTVQSARRHAFDDSDAVLLGLLADQAAIAISNARLYDELQRSERRYRFLVDNSPDIVWSVDAEGRFTFLSESLEGRTGWKPDQLLGQPFSVLTDDATRAAADAAWERVRANPDQEQRVRLDLPLPDGFVSASEVAMTGSVVDGRFAGAHGSVRDISERERLEGDLRVQAAELATSEERARLARELHDSVTQALFSMGLTTRSLELLLDTDPAAGRAKLAELRELQKDALAEMRTLIFELRPASLETDGLVQALRNHAAAVRARTGLEVSVDADIAERPPLAIEEALYRIGQEALHNVVKHANAERSVISLSGGRDGLRMSISDDGTGFDPEDVPRGHLGLVGMRQRAELIGAQLSIESARGSGTRVEIHVPTAAVQVAAARAAEGAASAE